MKTTLQVTLALILALLSGCSGDSDKVEPQPGPKPAESWILTGFNSGNEPDAKLGYLERIAYHDNLSIKTITGDTLTAAPEDPQFSSQHEYIYEDGRLTRVKEFDTYERTFHIAYELFYDAQQRVSTIDHYFSSATQGRVYADTRKFSYNAAGKVEKIETLDKHTNVRGQEVRYTWTGNNVTRQDLTNYDRGTVVNTWSTLYTYNDAADNVWKTIGKEYLAVNAYYDYVPHEQQIKSIVSTYPDNVTMTASFENTSNENGLITLRKEVRTYVRDGNVMSARTTYDKYFYRKQGS